MMRDELIGMAALHCTLAKMDGNAMDKKAMRFTAMADYMEHCAACGPVAAIDCLAEAVETAVVGSAMNIPGQPFDRSLWRWMEGGE